MRDGRGKARPGTPMDNLTHTLIGASIASLVMGRRGGARALVAGAVIANLPDSTSSFPTPTSSTR